MSVICTRCGSTDVACEAIVNPNGNVFRRYTDESFLYGQCEKCKQSAELTDPDQVKQDIDTLYQEYMSYSESEPDYVSCRITYKDDGKGMDVIISLKTYGEETDDSTDDRVFFYCDSLSDLKSLADYGMEDFILTACYRFNKWTSEELWLRKTYHIRFDDTSIDVTGKEIREYYGDCYPLDEAFIEKHAARTTAQCKLYRSKGVLLTPSIVPRLLTQGNNLGRGQSLSFRIDLHFRWYVEIQCEEDDRYLPFRYNVSARCLDCVQNFSRRYVSFERAFLHCLNGFNENANIKDRYSSIDYYMSKHKCL